MSFYIPETNETVTAINRPITIITSNAEKELPDAFLRRCVFHFIEFPTPELMQEIIKVHYPNIKDSLLQETLKTFYALREVDEFRKKPSTSELIDWIKALIACEVPLDKIAKEVPFVGALLKKETDYDHFVNNYLRNNGLIIRRR